MLHTQSPTGARSTDRSCVAITTPHSIKASVTVLRKKGDGKVIDLNRPVTLLGSHREVKIRLKHDSVAPVHCALINTGLRLLLRDFAGRAGTRVNGKRARSTELRNGDVIRIDAWKFRVNLKSNSDTCSGSSIMATLFCDQPSLDIEPVAGGNRWKNLPDVFVIGRRDTCEVRIESTNVSRAHALVCCLNGRSAIFDLMSANGLAVNGNTTSMAYLKQGDVVSLGDTALRIADVRGEATPECGESCYTFGDTTGDRIKLADPSRQGSSVDYVQFGGFEPQVADRDRFAGDIEKAHRSDARPDERSAKRDAREEQLHTREREMDDHQADLGKRELELGDREHQLRAAARKLVDENQAKLAKATDRARTEMAAQAEALQSQQAALDELRADVERRGHAVRESESQLAKLSATLEQRQSDLDARETNLRHDAEGAVEELREERESLRVDREALGARESAAAEQADAVAKMRSECETLRLQLERDRQALAEQTAAVDRLSAQLRQRESALTDREQATADQRVRADERATELDAAFDKLEEQRAELDRTIAESEHKRTAALTKEFARVETEMAARERVIQGLAKSVEQRAAELDARACKLNTREPLLNERSKSLDIRAGELDTRRREMAETRAECALHAQALKKRHDALRRREDALKTDEHLASQYVDPLAISDARSFEILRLLDPTLGDSVRVLRRLGFPGSFDELVALAQRELASHEDKKQRGMWNPFR